MILLLTLGLCSSTLIEKTNGRPSSARLPAANAPVWPPQIAPVMPTMFTAHVKGFIGNSLTDEGVWHYDWPRNRL